MSEIFAKPKTFDNQLFIKIASTFCLQNYFYFVIFLKKKREKYAGFQKTPNFTSPKLQTGYFEPFGNQCMPHVKHSRKKKILLVDDEPNILVALEYLFEEEGFTVQKAFDGHQALMKLQSFHPSIVVLDVMMPGMDGFEVARRIRHIEKYDNIQIVFLTAKGTADDRVTGYSSGGEVYLTKPFDNEELVNIVNEMVEFG
jgi:CheY-like chemotaxis protein